MRVSKKGFLIITAIIIIILDFLVPSQFHDIRFVSLRAVL